MKNHTHIASRVLNTPLLLERGSFFLKVAFIRSDKMAAMCQVQTLVLKTE